jgi:hypothetical protein
MFPSHRSQTYILRISTNRMDPQNVFGPMTMSVYQTAYSCTLTRLEIARTLPAAGPVNVRRLAEKKKCVGRRRST